MKVVSLCDRLPSSPVAWGSVIDGSASESPMLNGDYFFGRGLERSITVVRGCFLRVALFTNLPVMALRALVDPFWA